MSDLFTLVLEAGALYGRFCGDHPFLGPALINLPLFYLTYRAAMWGTRAR